MRKLCEQGIQEQGLGYSIAMFSNGGTENPSLVACTFMEYVSVSLGS